MSKNTTRQKHVSAELQSNAGFTMIAHWEAYEAFRSRALVFLVLYNVLLVVTNVCLAYSFSFGQELAVAAIIAGATAVFVAIQFSENIQKHFQGSPEVRATFQHAEEHLNDPVNAINFIRTIDGQLVILATLLGIVMVVQFWKSLH